MSDRWAPTAGDVVGGRYEVREFLGKGGFAKVWGAVDPTGATVALKHPNYDSSNDEGVVEKYFEKEADTLRLVSEAGGHPNVMTLHETLEDRGTPFLVVDRVQGAEMNQVVDDEGPLTDWNLLRSVGIDLCEAMSFLHRNEIIYRDLKPQNVMLTEEYVPRLIDFNTATGYDAEAAAAEGETTILGPFKPPELTDADGDARQGPWSDVYSVGTVLVYLASGEVPETDGVDLREFDVDPPAYLAEVIERATATDREQRYRNATVLERVLRARDPEPPSETVLSNVATGGRVTVGPGDTLGRRGAAGPEPSVALDDPQGGYVSAVQVEFDRDDEGRWLVRDQSLNGTYVQRGDGWEQALSRVGYERLLAKGKDPSGPDGDRPPEEVVVGPGDLVALVDPSYGLTFRFEGPR